MVSLPRVHVYENSTQIVGCTREKSWIQYRRARIAVMPRRQCDYPRRNLSKQRQVRQGAQPASITLDRRIAAATVLTAMGMAMVQPTLVSGPLKLMVFVAAPDAHD
jgi:FliP family